MPTIVQNISPALIEGATAIYIGGVQASALDASGNVLIDGNAAPPTNTAPTLAVPTVQVCGGSAARVGAVLVGAAACTV